MNTTAKAQGAGIGALSGSTITALIFGIWPQLVGPPWESVITAAVALILAVVGAWWPRNAITTAQVVAAAKAGDLSPALAGATNKVDATAVAKAIAEPSVGAGLTAAGAPKPIPQKGK